MLLPLSFCLKETVVSVGNEIEWSAIVSGSSLEKKTPYAFHGVPIYSILTETTGIFNIIK